MFTFDFHHGDVLDQFIEMGNLFLAHIMWGKKRIKLIKIDYLFGKPKVIKKVRNRNNNCGYFIRQLAICSTQIMLEFF